VLSDEDDDRGDKSSAKRGGKDKGDEGEVGDPAPGVDEEYPCRLVVSR
jgi:hypothetical protein